MQKQWPVAVSALALLPSVAAASDMTGMLTIMMLIWVVAPVTLVHLVVTLVLALLKLYRSKAVAGWHVAIAAIAPVLGMVVAVLELGGSRHVESLFIVLLILLFALALASLPLVIHPFQQPAYVRPRYPADS